MEPPPTMSMPTAMDEPSSSSLLLLLLDFFLPFHPWPSSSSHPTRMVERSPATIEAVCGVGCTWGVRGVCVGYAGEVRTESRQPSWCIHDGSRKLEVGRLPPPHLDGAAAVVVHDMPNLVRDDGVKLIRRQGVHEALGHSDRATAWPAPGGER